MPITFVRLPWQASHRSSASLRITSLFRTPRSLPEKTSSKLRFVPEMHLSIAALISCTNRRAERTHVSDVPSRDRCEEGGAEQEGRVRSALVLAGVAPEVHGYALPLR